MNRKNILNYQYLDSQQREEQKKVLLEEYKVLRSEITQLFSIRNQIVHFNLIVFGALITFGIQNIQYLPIFLLAYILISSFFAQGWAHNNYRIGEIGAYIKDNIESKIDGLSWESRFRENTKTQFRGQEPYIMGVFFFSQIISYVIVISLCIFFFNNKDTKFYFYRAEYFMLLFGAFFIFTLYCCAQTYRVIRARRKVDNLFNICFTTPVAGEKIYDRKIMASDIEVFIKNIKDINANIKKSLKKNRKYKNLKIHGHSINIYTSLSKIECTPDDKKEEEIVTVNQYRNVNTKETEMAYFWYSSIWNAFVNNPQNDVVFYYPIDGFPKYTNMNTKVNSPTELLAMMKLACTNQGVLVLGNYRLLNSPDKYDIEQKILNLYTSFQLVPKNVHTIRTEFFCVNRKLFTAFLEFYTSLDWDFNIDDPTLLLYLWSIKHGYQVYFYDLGEFVDDIRKDIEWQFGRAERLIQMFY